MSSSGHRQRGRPRKKQAKIGLDVDLSDMPEYDRSFNTWSKGNPHLAQMFPATEPILAPGEKFVHEDEDQPNLDEVNDERHPDHPDYGLRPMIPMHELITPNDPAYEHYRPWRGGFAPVLKFFRAADASLMTTMVTAVTENQPDSTPVKVADMSQVPSPPAPPALSMPSAPVTKHRKSHKRLERPANFTTDSNPALQTRARKK